MKDKIRKIDSLSLDLKKFPYEICALNCSSLIKKWTFTDENEAKTAYKSIWAEIFNTKTLAK
jgi:hypothetical protein